MPENQRYKTHDNDDRKRMGSSTSTRTGQFPSTNTMDAKSTLHKISSITQEKLHRCTKCQIQPDLDIFLLFPNSLHKVPDTLLLHPLAHRIFFGRVLN